MPRQKKKKIISLLQEQKTLSCLRLNPDTQLS